MRRMLIVLGALVVMCADPAAAAEKHEEKARAFATTFVKKWVSEATLVDAIKAQNAKHAGLGQPDIDRLDKQWRAETKAASKPLIDDVLGRPASKRLKALEADSQGLVTEIFLMDDKGLNVAQSDVTSDYWQGDEAKWQKTFSVGADAVFVDKVEKDESTQRFQVQVSMAVADPATGKVIGAITVGLDVEELLNR